MMWRFFAGTLVFYVGLSVACLLCMVFWSRFVAPLTTDQVQSVTTLFGMFIMSGTFSNIIDHFFFGES